LAVPLNFAVVYTFWKVQENQKGLGLNGLNNVFIYADTLSWY